MKKKTSHKHTAIQPDQILAIRCLAKAGKLEEALERIDKLIVLHPDHKPLYGLAWEVASTGEIPAFAIVRAIDWTRVSPNSANAWQAIADDALAAGYLALGFSARDRLATLAGQPVAPTEDFETAFGTMRMEEAIANDMSRVFMASGQFDKALAVLDGFGHVSLRNNAALIRFQLGDIRAALSAFEENWQREPRNLFALEYIVRLRLWTRGRDAAAGLTAPLKTTPAARNDDALARINALLILGDWQGADAAWREAADADFWQGPREIDKSGVFDFAGGIAAWRLGDFEAMAERFDDAAETLPTRRELIQRIMFATAMPSLGEVPDIPLGEFSQWFPQEWIDQLVALKTYKGKETEDRYDALMRKCDAHPDYLCAAAELGGESARFLAISILKLRAKESKEAARQALVTLLARPCGPDKVRSGLHADMVDLGWLPEGGTVSMLAQGQIQEIRHLALKIHANPSSPELPPESHAQLEKVFDLMAQRRLDDCILILEDLIARHPGKPSLYNNLAGIKEGLGHPDSEVEALLQKAHELDPDYLFAVAGLARLAARRGEIERATTMLDPLLGREFYHFTEWRSILMTQVDLAKGQGNLGAALNLQKQIVELQKQFD